MFAAMGNKLTQFFKSLGEVVKQRREKKLARLAAVEKRERKAIVEALARKLEEAHSECEQEGQTSVVLVLSLKEIVFMKGNLDAWIRHFRESEIFAAPPKR
jgi:hypothetical protein